MLTLHPSNEITEQCLQHHSNTLTRYKNYPFTINVKLRATPPALQKLKAWAQHRCWKTQRNFLLITLFTFLFLNLQ